MYNSFDGKTYKRVGGGLGDRLPSEGIKRTRATYTATGGETSINLASLSPAITYHPGLAQLDVKRSSGGSLIANLDFIESSPTTIDFPSTEPLEAGEIVEITRSIEFVGVMAANIRPDAYSATATAGQTVVTAGFSWQYNALPGVGVGGVMVYLHGIAQTRGVDYTEVDFGNGQTNRIQFVDALAGGENILIVPTNYVTDSSAGANTFTAKQITDVQSVISSNAQAFILEERVSVPNTLILNRSKARAADSNLRPSLGIERIRFNSVEQATGEVGPNRELVYKLAGDDSDRIRFYSAEGPRPELAESPDAVIRQAITFPSPMTLEVYFYGTGLNILTRSSVPSFTVTVDGASVSPPAHSGGSATGGSAIALYQQYSTFVVARDLNAGAHTVSVTFSALSDLQGIEIVGAGSLTVSPGSAAISGSKVSSTGATSAFNAGFANIADGSVGTRGGRAVVYMKANGQIEKAFTPVAASSTISASAPHTNESVVREMNWHEFTSGSAQDLGTYDETGAWGRKAFVSNDNSTAVLVGDGILGVIGDSLGVTYSSGNPFTVFTFVGSGVDIKCSATNVTVDVDGTTFTMSASAEWKALASGLPFGTHVVKISGGTAFTWQSIRVWGPSKPSIPASSVELADYYLTGTTILKSAMREVRFKNATYGSPSSSTTHPFHVISTASSSQEIEYVFWGTEVNFAAFSNSSTVQSFLRVDGAVKTSGVTVSGGSYNTSTGEATLGTSSRVSITGLALGVHVVRISTSATVNLRDFAVTTPVFHYSSDLGVDSIGYAPPAALMGIADTRKFSPTPKELKAKNSIFSYSSVQYTSSSTFNRYAISAAPFYSKTGRIKVSFNLNLSGATGRFQVMVDGKSVYSDLCVPPTTSNSYIVNVGKGQHLVVLWFNNNGSGTATVNPSNTTSKLIVEDVYE